MQIRDYIDDIARSTGFLSRLPVPARFFTDHDGALSRASGMFPAAGVIIALLPALIMLGLSAANANAALTALLVLMVLTGVTGALHEDGLADSADAFGARGGRAHMLEIMKDSRIGAYGVLALMTGFALRATALTIILSVTGGWYACLLLLAAAAISRACMVWHWNELPPARLDGVAASVGAPYDSARTTALVSGVILFGVLAAFCIGLIPAVIALAITALAAHQWTALVRKRLGGHTGDTIGATQQITETACLVTLALLL
ncbi:adenosylcobinamide-GDP ribazoletransferase [Hoeflea ulvae]|uniref:Adenosylcobinamide-GDP ribazoletransferase n=1 Tax=Hoeflea ulvae TaxID=2983764 RepID=A0ABT3YIV0_9HYPH|nr:adenosylcobinamide-GDP ribazoletransferase [Hoeflea ulvae]MCY0095537.1 adenosylcobinamide-GDP ribazoletransferase [Hoeflea ulvae]